MAIARCSLPHRIQSVYRLVDRFKRCSEGELGGQLDESAERQMHLSLAALVVFVLSR